MALNSSPIIIAKADGKIRDGLLSILENQPFILIIGAVQDELSLLEQLGLFSGECIILLDINLFANNTFNILNRIHAEYPRTSSILLVNTFHQKKTAISMGFNNLLIKGFNADDLLTLIHLATTAKRLNNKPVETDQVVRL